MTVSSKASLIEWSVEALNHFGGRAHHLDIAKWIWSKKRDELFEMGDLFYSWQYELRWAGTEMRGKKIILSANDSPKGTWILSGD